MAELPENGVKVFVFIIEFDFNIALYKNGDNRDNLSIYFRELHTKYQIKKRERRNEMIFYFFRWTII